MPKVIEVRYWRDEPTVIVPPELTDVTVRIVDAGAEDQLVLTHSGVSVFRAMKDLDMGQENCLPSDYWCASSPYTDWESDTAFDIRSLRAIPEAERAKYQALFPDDGDKQRLAYAIDSGEIKNEE